MEQPQPPLADSDDDDSILRFTSRRLGDGMMIAGPASLILYFSSDSPDADVHARLLEVTPDGRRVLIIDNMLRTRFRNGRLAPALLDADAIYPLNLRLGHIAHAVAPGSRLQLELTGSNFPAWSLNPNGDAPPFQAETNAVAHSRVYSGPGLLSELVLPVAGSAIVGARTLPVFEPGTPLGYCPTENFSE